jgi:tight adherence protein C
LLQFSILAGFFLVVLTATGVVGYFALFRDRRDEPGEGSLMGTFERIGRVAPIRPEESDRLRRRLSLAGHNLPAAAPIFSGIRVASAALVGLLLFGVALYRVNGLSPALLAALCGALIGFLLPNRLLDRAIRRRSEKLRAGLPTAVDLMVLSLEAGQSLDAALNETSRELRESFPELTAELTLVQREILASKSRGEAYRNLANRNEEIEIRRFAQVLVETDRFGTSLAPTLRAHSHYLKLRLRQKAREAARKVGVKLIFPLFFLIFPAVLLVTLGPAVLQVVSQLAPMLANAVP